ncbi:hypothetical protein ACWEKM_07050 [Streptomyces sp. NPDC004752]
MTTPPLHVCRACDGLITDPEDAVLLWHEMGNSGPGRNVYAHAEHVDMVEIIDPTLLRITLRIWAAKMQPKA